jgi:mannose-6-phosphate isomerase-like protein (cupin superfamily)
MLRYFAHLPILRLGMLVTGLALPVAATHSLAAEGNAIEVKPIDAVVKANPLPRDTPAAIVESFRAGSAELGVLVMRENRLHHHSHQDHVLYLVRGEGLAQLENAAGQVETRTVKPGDILALPRGKKHGFRKSGEEDLVFLVVATPLPPGVEETTYHE